MVHQMRGAHVPGGSKRVEEEAPQDPHRAGHFGVNIGHYRFKMSGLKSTSGS